MSSTYLTFALQALIQPLQGGYSSGTVRVRATGDPVLLPANSFGIPIARESRFEAGAVKVERNPARTDRAWQITQSGTDVQVTTLQGGEHTNLEVGTYIWWDPAIEGIESESDVLSPGIVGGTTATGFGALREVLCYKDLGTKPEAEDFMRAGLSRYPALVICWSATTPADGSSTAGIGPDATRVRHGTRLFSHQFDLMLITSRLDAHNSRRREGDVLRDMLLTQITDRGAYRSLTLSGPKGIQIIDARLAQMSPVAYVDVVRIAATLAMRRNEERVWNPWKSTHYMLDRDTSAGDKRTVDTNDPMPGWG